MNHSIRLHGTITNITYKPYLIEKLPQVMFYENVNNWASSCQVTDGNFLWGVSKWVSPKRTRSYPYSRIYNTLNLSSVKLVTIIPLVKDEGKDGDRDYLQWDTISLMSSLNIYVIIAYYHDAEKNMRLNTKQNKVTHQKFYDDFVKEQMNLLLSYHSSALHWNLHQLEISHLDMILSKSIQAFQEISTKTGVIFHSEQRLYDFREKISEHRDSFLRFSREKAKQAQNREVVTIQPKESLGHGIKATIDIKNYLGGTYYFTIDEVIIKNNTYFLVESKHTKKSILPSKNDIKDGLIKMVLYTSIDQLFLKSSYGALDFLPVLRLTSQKIKYRITSKANAYDIKRFIDSHSFKKSHQKLIDQLFQEANKNNFQVIIEYAKD